MLMQGCMLLFTIFTVTSVASQSTGSLRSGSPPKTDGFLSKQDAKEELAWALDTALSTVHRKDANSLKQIAVLLEASYEALPKGPQGSLSETSLRYLVHSYFMKEHGWLIRGLEHTNGDIADSDSDMLLLKDKLPFFIQIFFHMIERRAEYMLSDAVALVAALEHLILNEGIAVLEQAYAMNGLSTEKELQEEELLAALKTFLQLFTFGNHHDLWGADEHGPSVVQYDSKMMNEKWPTWSDREFMMLDVEKSQDFLSMSQANPFKARVSFSFEQVSTTAMAVSTEVGRMHNMDCQDLKAGLAEFDTTGSGRVSLKDFYSKGQIGFWELRDSTSFLRQLGALDETSESLGPRVIIPNYVTAISNCEAPSDYFSICCIHECQGLMTQLERQLKHASAAPERILGVVERLQSSTIMAPRNLSDSLVGSLNQIAEQRDGQVLLHGRLFAQWMHYAFPHECPYPHMSKKFNPLTEKDWVKLNAGESTTVTHEELARIEMVLDKSMEESMEEEEVLDPMAMWTWDDEMLTGEAHPELKNQPAHSPSAHSWFTSLAQMTAGIFVLLSLWRSLSSVVMKSKGGDSKKLSFLPEFSPMEKSHSV